MVAPLNKIVSAVGTLPEPMQETAYKWMLANKRDKHKVTAIRKWKGLTKAERRVLEVIARKCNAFGWAATNYREIGQKAEYSEEQVGRIIRGLERKQVLEINGEVMKGKDGKPVPVRNKEGAAVLGADGKPKVRRLTHPNSTQSYAIHERKCCFQE